MNGARFSVCLFGGFELRRDGQAVELPVSSQRLIGFLATQDRGLDRGFVAASLWPDTTDQKAAANLRTALWRLRRPEFDVVLTTNGHVSLRPDVWVDIRALRAAARDHRRTGALPSDDLMIELRGELMPGCWDGWLVFERERLRQEAVHLCEALCAASLARNDIHRGVLYSLAAVECDPLRESANIWVVRAYLAAGNRACAMRHAARYAAILNDELGIDPPPMVDELLWSAPGGVVTIPA